MSGDFQHFIPQHVLKAFKIQGYSGGKSVWVYREKIEPEIKKVADIAAETHFYSPPAIGELTLDDTITKYENRLARLIQQLRKTPTGPVADSNVPAEVLAHLTIRTDSMRSGMTYGAQQIAVGAFGILSDMEQVRKLAGLESDEPSAAIKEAAEKLALEHPIFSKLNLPKEALERLLLTAVRENFDQFAAQGTPVMQAALAKLYGEADHLVAKSQKKVLETSLVPDGRAAALKNLSWEIFVAPEANILPDCVAIALTKDCRVTPLGFSGNDELGVVMMALDPKRLLIGRTIGAEMPNLVLYNVQAASCSEKFFVASAQNPIFPRCTEIIGSGSKKVIHKGIRDALEPYSTSQEPTSRLPGLKPNIHIHLPPVQNGLEPTLRSGLQQLIDWTAERIPLDTVTDLHISLDISATANSIDRGDYKTAPIQLPAEVHGFNVDVLREGRIATQVILSARVAEALFQEAEPDSSMAMYLVVRMLAEAWAVGEFDVSFPGVLHRPHSSSFNEVRYEQVVEGWLGYFASCISAAIAPMMLDTMRIRTLRALADAQQHIKAARIEWRFHQDTIRLARETLPYIRNLLLFAGNLAGFKDALEDNLSSETELLEALGPLGLTTWLTNYRRDLKRLYDSRGHWRSVDEFMALGNHVERLMLQLGLVLSPAEGGQARLFVALGIDQAAYEEEAKRREAKRPGTP